MRSRRTFPVVVLAAVAALAACDPVFVSRFNAAFRERLATPPDGKTCADGSDFAALVPDCPFDGLCFTPACEAHDACYADCRAARAECDRWFLADMIDICNSQFAFDDPTLRECLYFANIYWGVIDVTRHDFYDCDSVPTGND